MPLHRQYLLFVLVFCVFSLSNATRVSLTGTDWTITDDAGNYSVPARVPGTIHTNLQAANRISDPYLGLNDVDQRFLIKNNWMFSKNFSLSPDILASNQVTLHFDQIDTVATVTLNGYPVGQTNSMFIPYTFPILSAYLKSNNYLQIHFESPVIYAANQSAAYNDTVPPLCPPDAQHGECHPQFIRKEPCSFSWDWVRTFNPQCCSLDQQDEVMSSVPLF